MRARKARREPGAGSREQRCTKSQRTRERFRTKDSQRQSRGVVHEESNWPLDRRTTQIRRRAIIEDNKADPRTCSFKAETDRPKGRRTKLLSAQVSEKAANQIKAAGISCVKGVVSLAGRLGHVGRRRGELSK